MNTLFGIELPNKMMEHLKRIAPEFQCFEALESTFRRDPYGMGGSRYEHLYVRVSNPQEFVLLMNALASQHEEKDADGKPKYRIMMITEYSEIETLDFKTVGGGEYSLQLKPEEHDRLLEDMRQQRDLYWVAEGETHFVPFKFLLPARKYLKRYREKTYHHPNWLDLVEGRAKNASK